MAFTPKHWMAPDESSAILFPFLSMNGTMVHAQQTFEREVRPGVNGVAIWLTGRRGEPFQISTTIDCTSAANAGIAFAAYHAAIATKKNLYYCSALWGTILIHNVVIESMTAFRAGTGGIQNFSGGSGTLLRTSWTIETLYSY